ncbi:nuclear GTP-binding protein nug1 [Malassezia yamatoensis]|uniref:Nuclear GTP-binding protein nug1 n=1 Tax=Malassezia yamatoensis TaxID=253288 RepID=A0AAJ6CKL9_9BASI|nr:nuclear GTP-binding protein nug1 [Malassezia yamatoensis]
MRKKRSDGKGHGRNAQQIEGRRPNLPTRSGRITCAKQSNAELLQLNEEMSQKDTEQEPTADLLAARARLTQLTERDNSLKAYMKELRKVLEHADVILEVVDVRDPLGCRAYALEREAQSQGKRVVLILNKIDLVPASNTRAWLEYLRQELPTLPFKASTQQQRSHLGQGPSIVTTKSHSNGALTHGAEAAGTKAILQLIKNYSRNLNLKSSITVGTIGAPNVGKSSLINSLKRSRVCSVASTPGHTKVVQGVMLDRQVRLLDSPGIVFTDSNVPSNATPQEALAAAEAAMLRNVLKVELVEDPIEPVQAILHRIDPQYLADVYQLESLPSTDANDFLLRVAYQKGRITKGALPDLIGTARSVLHDWNTGKIKYHTEPPAKAPAHLHRNQGPIKPGEAPKTDQVAVVSSFSDAFDLAGLLGEADAEVFAETTPASVPLPPTQATSTELESMQPQPDTSLGKHQRESDSECELDADEFRGGSRTVSRNRNAFASLLPSDVDEQDSDLDSAQDAHMQEDTQPKSAASKKSQQQLIFPDAVRESMAVPRGKQRRKVRKEKKRQAGLDVQMDVIMDLHNDDDTHEAESNETRQIFSTPLSINAFANKPQQTQSVVAADEQEEEEEL